MRLVGAYRFSPSGAASRGAVIALPRAWMARLPGTHLLFPPDCLIDDGPNCNFGIIRTEPHEKDSEVVSDNGVPCHRIYPSGGSDRAWPRLPAAIDACLAGWTRTTRLAPETVYAALISELASDFEAAAADFNAGAWWITTPLTWSGLGPAFRLRDSAGVIHGDPLQPCVKLPMTLRLVAESAGEPVRQFEKLEAEVLLDPDYFHACDSRGHASARSAFDAYDADHVGERIAVDVRFRLMHSEGSDRVVEVDGVPQVFDLPGFFMKSSPAGPFQWKARFAPPLPTSDGQSWEMTARAVVWHRDEPRSSGGYDEMNRMTRGRGETYYHYWGYNEHRDPLTSCTGNRHTQPDLYQPVDRLLPVPTLRFACASGRRQGPLQCANAGEFYLRQLRRDAGYTPQPFFILGQVTPWAFPGGPAALDRSRDLLAPMARMGMNFNYTWLAPWETMLVHRGATEDWYLGAEDSANPSGPTKESAPVSHQGWRSYAYYDQGRAARLDDIVEAHDAHDIYHGIVIWPHDALAQNAWTTEGTSSNGFGAIPDTTLDRFFSSAQDPASAEWLWQQNYYRYLVARYGYSRTLAVWWVVAELEGVGPTPFAGDYWNDHAAATHCWHDRVVATLRGLDHRRRIVASSTTQFSQSQAEPYRASVEIPGRGDFRGYQEQIDLLCTDIYPTVYSHSRAGAPSDWVNDEARFFSFCRTALAAAQARLWHYVVGRIVNWVRNTRSMPQPHLASEFGIVERGQSTDAADSPANPVLENQVRSYIHFAIWAAFASGYAGTPLKWCDQNRFGSLFPHGLGSFAPGRYADFSTEYLALLQLLRYGGPLDDFGRLRSRLDSADVLTQAPGRRTLRALGLRDGTSLIVIWLFDDDVNNVAGRDYAWTDGHGHQHAKQNAADAHAQSIITLSDLKPDSTYTVERYNTWDGGVLPEGDFQTSAHGAFSMPLGRFATTTSSRADTVWDGADVLLIVRLSRM